MTDTDNGTTATGGEGDASASTSAPTDEVTLLRSRLQGLDAKVSALTEGKSAAERAAAEAAAKLSAYEAGKVGADEALRAQLLEKEAEIAKERKNNLLLGIKAAHPEAYAAIGEAAAALAPEALAALEARLKGVASEPADSPTPNAHNEAKSSTTAAKGKQKSADDLEAELLAMGRPAGW